MRKFTLILSLLVAMVTTAMAQITSVEQFSNNKCYTIAVAESSRGTWYYNPNDPTGLYSTGKLGISVDPTDVNQQFAFINYNGNYYLYSVGAKKFVDKTPNGYTTLSEYPGSTVTLDATTGDSWSTSHPVVVSLNGSHIGVSNNYEYGVITFYNSTNDGGNCVAINEVEGKTFDPSAAISAIEEYLNAEAAKEYVTAVEDFTNNGIYTFVSNRSENAYMMYDASVTDYFISQYKHTSLTVGSDVENCQWAVYKSDNGYYYLYNLGAKKFMGTESTGNASIPASDTPQSTQLTFKNTTVATHPIMFSTDGGTSVVNHSNLHGEGLISWNGGWGFTDDTGNVHKVEKVGTLDETTIATIKAAVEAYETTGIYISELENKISDTKNKYYDSWNASWRIGEGLNSYSMIDEDATPINEVIANAEAYLAGNDVTVQKIEEYISAIDNAINNLTINLPEQGKFYRIRCTDGKKYLSSEINNNKLVMNGSEKARIFMYTNDALLSYTEGLYINANNLNGIGTTSTVTFSAGKPGSYYVNVGERYIYGTGDAIDSGTETDNRGGYSWWLEEVTSLPVTVGDAGYATLYFPVATTIPQGVTAYVLTSTSESNAVLTALEGTIPANQGVIIEAAAGNYNFDITDDVEFEGTNMLTGATATANVASGVITLTLQNNATSGIGLYKYTGTEVGIFKAHLELPEAQASNGFSFRIEGTTGIDEVKGENENVKAIYDLTGRRVERINAPGIYIINGKKVVIK